MSKLPYSGNLDSEIPPEVRKKVYEEAIFLIQTERYTKYGLDTPQLCLMLPCILWQLKDYMKCGPNRYEWANCKSAFPEFGKKELSQIAEVRRQYSNKETDIKRLEIMQIALEKVKIILKKEKDGNRRI